MVVLTKKVEKIPVVVKEEPKVPALSSVFTRRDYLPKWMVSSLDCLLARLLQMEGEEKSREIKGR